MVRYPNNKKMAEIENINALSSSSNNDNWNPEYGEETEKLLSKFFGNDIEAKEKVKEETYHIMQLCGNPENETNEDTGLVFGYVQSGKTLSFTTLTALARDNNYQIVIILAGISTNLVNQSYSRLLNDLNINKGGIQRKWVLLNNPADPIKNPQDKNTIKRELDKWKKPNTPAHFKKTLLITVMKNTSHLKNLLSVLRQLDLSKVPTLIIDDEGDQASMNTKASSNARNAKTDGIHTELEMSTIYGRIRSLKAILPHHTFIQYTATPQAPLFIHILDNLSPNFIQLLTPGEKYTGGIAFFLENHFIVRNIPYSEIYSDNNPFDEAPETLKEAMRTFFLSVTVGYLLDDKKGNPKNRSMMVHPSRLVDEQGIYYEWVNNIKSHWAKVLLRNESDETRQELIIEFKKSYKDLKSNVSDLPTFEALLTGLGHHISDTAVEQLNSRAGSSVDWNNNYSFILVGGQAMDRGFTVEGLTITYMPRSKGVGNADTIQQRARFFGYKKDFLGHCRVYLDAENQHLFSEYVNHEEDIRKKLAEHKLTGLHLNKMKRSFVLSEMFKLTRKNVLSEDLTRTTFGNKWVRIKAPHDSEIIIESNRDVFDKFLSKYNDSFTEDIGHKDRTEDQKHLVAKIPLKDLFIDLLNDLKFTRQSDSTTYTSLKSVIDLYTDEFPPEDSFIYLMNKGNRRIRSFNDKKDEIKELFQGKNPRTGEVIYPGDDKIKSEDSVTVQVHNIDFRNTDYENIITVAVWVPARLSQSLISKLND